MKIGFAFLLTAILVFASLPLSANEPVTVQDYPVELRYDSEVPGPVRDDPFDDWIIYDNDNPRSLYPTRTFHWVKVTFTPVSDFVLQGIWVMPLNQGPNFDDTMHLRVYSEDQNDHDLEDLLLEYDIERVNDAFDENYIQLDEDDWLEFDGNENFTIMYDVPGGDYEPGNGQGWWCLFDGANDFSRSFVVFENNPPDAHRSWGEIPGDLMLRANGEYEPFTDISLTTMYNVALQWMMVPGTEQTFVVDVVNIGADIDGALLTFRVDSEDEDDIWHTDVFIRDIEEGEERTVEAEETWEAPNDVGLYSVWCTIETEDDADPENNSVGLDQIVFDPENESDYWIGYIDDTIEGTNGWNEDSGWAIALYHPGGDVLPLGLSEFRVMIYTEAQNGGGIEDVELEFGIAILNLDEGQFTPIWDGTANTTGEGTNFNNGVLEWIEIDPELDDSIAIFPGDAFLITYFYDDETRFPGDDDPPIAGTNESDMPLSHLSTQDDGGGYNAGGSGDYAIQARLFINDVPERGAHLRIEPDMLEFGYGLEMEQEYTIEALFISYGTETVEIENLRRAPSAEDYITLDPNEGFDIEPGDTAIVTVTFVTDEEIELESRILVQNNTAQANLIWLIHASTGEPPAEASFEPVRLEFGYELQLDEIYTIESYIYSTGGEDLVISGIDLPQGFEDNFTVDPDGEFTIVPGDSALVTVTFQAEDKTIVESHLTVNNNSYNEPEYEWPVQASTESSSINENIRPGIPEQVELSQNYPNPFNPVTTIDFALTKAGHISFDVFDMNGRLVKEVYHGNLPAGYHSLEIDASGLPAGIYSYSLTSGSFTSMKKMVLLK